MSKKPTFQDIVPKKRKKGKIIKVICQNCNTPFEYLYPGKGSRRKYCNERCTKEGFEKNNLEARARREEEKRGREAFDNWMNNPGVFENFKKALNEIVKSKDLKIKQEKYSYIYTDTLLGYECVTEGSSKKNMWTLDELKNLINEEIMKQNLNTT
jgi:hypothetical protein